MKILHRNLLLALALGSLAATLTVRSQTPAPAAPPARLGSAVFRFEDLKVKPGPVGVRRDVADLPTATLDKLECHITTLNAGNMSHPPHRHPQEEFIILREGTLDVFINGKVQRIGPGSLFFFASNDQHNVTNVGDKPATYFVFNVATAATKTVPAQAAAESAAPGTLPSSVFDWDKLTVKSTKTGERRDIFNSPTVTCASLEAHVTTLNPGESPHALHHHPDEELILVKDGLVEVTIGGVAQRAGPSSICFFASNDEHGMKNIGTTPATYYVIRVVTAATPNPAKPM
jgi:quercetin dioxygenase-like cupin family protein